MFVRTYPSHNIFIASEKFINLEHFLKEKLIIRDKKIYEFKIYCFQDNFKKLKKEFYFKLFRKNNDKFLHLTMYNYLGNKKTFSYDIITQLNDFYSNDRLNFPLLKEYLYSSIYSEDSITKSMVTFAINGA